MNKNNKLVNTCSDNNAGRECSGRTAQTTKTTTIKDPRARSHVPTHQSFHQKSWGIKQFRRGSINCRKWHCLHQSKLVQGQVIYCLRFWRYLRLYNNDEWWRNRMMQHGVRINTTKTDLHSYVYSIKHLPDGGLNITTSMSNRENLQDNFLMYGYHIP